MGTKTRLEIFAVVAALRARKGPEVAAYRRRRRGKARVTGRQRFRRCSDARSGTTSTRRPGTRSVECGMHAPKQRESRGVFFDSVSAFTGPPLVSALRKQRDVARVAARPHRDDPRCCCDPCLPGTCCSRDSSYRTLPHNFALSFPTPTAEVFDGTGSGERNF